MERSEILKKLAETLDINSFLAEHPELEKQDIIDGLRWGSDLIWEKENPPPIKISNLYRAYNGTVAGFFVGASLLFDFRKEYDLRNQATKGISDFLVTYSNQFKNNAEVGSDYANMEEAIEQELKAHDTIITEYYLLGLAIFRYITLLDNSDETEDDLQTAKHLLTTLGHAPLLLEKATRKFRENTAKKDPTWQEMMNACMQVLRELIMSIEEEKNTCFVAIPFVEPYLERYLDFYRAIAKNMNMLAIRAWGGLGNEDHQEMLFTLVAKSGALLADVTEPNANVSMEVGYALGKGKRLWLVAEGNNWRNVSNVKMDWVFPYNISEDKYWPFEQADRAGLYLTALEATKRPGPIPSWHTDPIEIFDFFNSMK